MIPLQHDLKEFLRLLSDHHVKYLLIGGYAVSYHGYPRSTADMDIWIETSPRMHRRSWRLCRHSDSVRPALDPIRFSYPTRSPDGHSPLQIEILTTISGLDFAEAYARRVVDVIEEVPVSLISAADLKTNKRASGRLKDLADLDNLP